MNPSSLKISFHVEFICNFLIIDMHPVSPSSTSLFYFFLHCCKKQKDASKHDTETIGWSRKRRPVSTWDVRHQVLLRGFLCHQVTVREVEQQFMGNSYSGG
ncbi:hypothetical protein XELAEV_18001383mg [Xenopus laevis]|nr:hypothetical protein XELAEV_18001383mg [Xenopus laevis]